MEPDKPGHRGAAGTVAVILAVAMGIALNLVTAALLYAAIIRLGIDINAGLSDNGVQVLLAWGGGIISVLAGYVGYIVGRKEGQNGSLLPGAAPPPAEPKPETPPP